MICIYDIDNWSLVYQRMPLCNIIRIDTHDTREVKNYISIPVKNRKLLFRSMGGGGIRLLLLYINISNYMNVSHLLLYIEISFDVRYNKNDDM